MFRRESIVIQEPPMRELEKKRSCLKRTCLTGCGGILFFVLAFAFLLHFLSGPKERELGQIPGNVLGDVPLYDVDNIESIHFVPGAKKNRILEIAIYIPKIILSPLILAMDARFSETDERAAGWKRMVEFVREPVADHSDTYTIIWQNLAADSNFIYTYYKNEMKKAGFNLTESPNNESGEDIIMFVSADGEKNGYVSVRDRKRESGTDFVSLTIHVFGQ